MRMGVNLPEREPGFGTDLGAIREFVQAAESMGYHHVRVGDHVLGANAASRPGWQGPYSHTDLWHEPFVLFGYLAGIAQKLELVTSILILPQRQTVLAAKQASAVDVLSGGRLRLGIGIGWNDVEFEALGEDFRDRGRRCEEQIAVMRSLWTQELVTFEGRWHRITDAGLNPMPVQRPIPIWIGGGPGSVRNTSTVESDRVLKRIARVADGWFPSMQPGGDIRAAVTKLHEYMRQGGRSLSEVGIEGSVSIGDRGPEDWARKVQDWKDLGASYISVNTGGAGLSSCDAHIDALGRFKAAVSDVVG